VIALFDPIDQSRGGFIPWWRTSIGDEDISEIVSAVRAEHVSMGPITVRLEQRLAEALDVPFVVATTSGSVALTLAMMALDIGPGDEIVVPDRTFIATAHAATTLGARVVLADCMANHPNVDPGEIGRKISSRTKAIVIVHLNGMACRTREIAAIASEHGLPVIEDAAQAIFSRSQDGNLGTQGTLGCFSFGMTKLISTGQGGAIVTRSAALCEKLRAMRNHGVRDTVSHEYLMMGNNFKFTDLQAAVGLGQVARAPEKVERCNIVYRTYKLGLKALDGLSLLEVKVDKGECALWVEIISQRRDELSAYLAGRGIQTRKFLPSLHTAPHLAAGEDFPNSAHFERTGMILPSGPAQPLENIYQTIEVIREWSLQR
jgi:perosamine synthetase